MHITYIYILLKKIDLKTELGKYSGKIDIKNQKVHFYNRKTKILIY